MNKYQEALEFIEFPNNGDPSLEEIEIENKSIETLRELVEKATPKKPICYWDNQNELYKYDCSSCRKQLAKHGEHSNINKVKKPNICSTCGQAIDWSKDEI